MKTLVKVASQAATLKKIVSLKQSVEHTYHKLNRQKVELWTLIYLWCEGQAAKEQWTISDCIDHLIEVSGASRGYWLRGRRIGQMMADLRIDPSAVKCSSLHCVSSVDHAKMKAPDKKKIATALSEGTGPSEMRRMLSEFGYINMQTMPNWTKKEIKAHKATLEDWRPEIEQLAKSIRVTRPGAVITVKDGDDSIEVAL